MCGRSEANSSPRLIPKPPAPPSHRRPSPRFPPEPCSQRQFPAQGTHQPHLGLAMSSSGRPFIFTAVRLGERSKRQAIARQHFLRRFCRVVVLPAVRTIGKGVLAIRFSAARKRHGRPQQSNLSELSSSNAGSISL